MRLHSLPPEHYGKASERDGRPDDTIVSIFLTSLHVRQTARILNRVHFLMAAAATSRKWNGAIAPNLQTGATFVRPPTASLRNSLRYYCPRRKRFSCVNPSARTWPPPLPPPTFHCHSISRARRRLHPLVFQGPRTEGRHLMLLAADRG